MEKILITDEGYITVYDNEDNAITYSTILYVDQNEIYVSKKGGQVITPTKVINVNPNDIVLPFRFYSEKESKMIGEVIVITDPVAAHDVLEMKELIKQHKEYKKDEVV